MAAQNKKKKNTANAGKESTPPPDPGQSVISDDIIPPDAFPVVGIGSSAGGLDALQRFFKHVPESSGIAYIVVSHLDPDHVSMLPELLQSCFKGNVCQIEDGMTVEKDCTYIIPPNKDLTILNGKLHLLDLVKQAGVRLAIDNFLRSLAVDQKHNAISVILSGAGSDGSLGLRDIRRESGMVMVQDPETAQFDSMPRNAIQTNLVDYVLPPERMPDQLLNYVKTETIRGTHTPVINDDIIQSLGKICALIRNHTGHDFSSYKQNTICRRIERRLNVHQLERTTDYVRYLSETPKEVTTLFQELLIGVTSFFRDPDNFDCLKEKVLLPLLEKKSDHGAIRVWIPGSSTGEEAYSMAILLQECMDELKKHVSVQIFATDIDDEAIEAARNGVFPPSIAVDLGEERLRRFFVMENGSYLIKKDIRAMLTFATHNILKDPPFSKLDLLSCRNLMIYLDSSSQKRLMSVFHYSLLPDGVLFLGGSESISGATDLFSTIDQKCKLFRKQQVTPLPSAILSFPVNSTGSEEGLVRLPKQDLPIEPKVFHRLERCLLEKYAPASVVVDAKGEIVYVVHGDTGKYLDLAHGRANLNIIKMAKRGLRGKITTTLNKVVTSKKSMILNGLRIKYGGRYHTFNLIIEPMIEPDLPSGFFLVVFEDVECARPLPELSSDAPVELNSDSRFSRLEDELRIAKEDLQATMELMESSNEELKSTNEELQSTNEELQSSNEELVTSKEEMQSLNEELSTVNSENEARIADMTKAYDDIRNLLNCTPFATIFVDCQLRIRRFTPQVTKIMNFIDTDINRPLADITTRLDYSNMVHDVQGVLDTLALHEEEVSCQDGRTFIMRILPYRTVANVIDGAVITFIDVTEHKKLTALNQRYASVLQAVSDAIILIDHDGNINVWNSSAAELYGWNTTDAQEITIASLIPKNEQKRFFATVNDIIRTGSTETFEMKRLTKQGTTVMVQSTLTRVLDDQGNLLGVACSEHALNRR